MPSEAKPLLRVGGSDWEGEGLKRRKKDPHLPTPRGAGVRTGYKGNELDRIDR